MSEPEGVKMSLTCGPGMCDMDTASTKDGLRMFAGGAEGLLKVRKRSSQCTVTDCCCAPLSKHTPATFFLKSHAVYVE